VAVGERREDRDLGSRGVPTPKIFARADVEGYQDAAARGEGYVTSPMTMSSCSGPE
jgi:hypothetical protein